MRSKLDLNSYDITLFARKSASKVLLLCIGSLANVAFGQDNDTIKVTTNPLYQQTIEHINQLPVTLSNQEIKDFTHTEVYFNYKNNQFARRQTASETSRYGFKAQGLFNTRNDVKIFGAINLEKINEKDVAYILDDSRTDDLEVAHPHYYYVPRASDWTNQQYHISAGAIKSFGGLNLAALASLDANKFSRQVDPRPEISNRKLNGDLQIGYTLGKHQIFAFGSYGQKDKDYSYYYSNTQLDNIGYPETYIRFQSGYGRVTNKPYNTSQLFTRTSYRKYGGGYQYKSANTSLIGEYHYIKNLENLYNEDFVDERFKRFQYQSIGHNGSFRLRQLINQSVLRATVKASQMTSKNYDVVSAGTNYINRQRNFIFDANILTAKNTFVKSYFGAFVSYNQNRYLDHLGYIDQNVNSLTVGIYGNRDLDIKNNSKINLGLGANYYTALKHNLDYLNITGASDNVFLREVINYDFAYNSIDKLEAKADVRYILPVKNNKNVVIYTQLRSIFALDKNRNNVVDIDTNTTYQVNFGIQLNY